MRIALISLGLLGLLFGVFGLSSAEPPTRPAESDHARLRAELRQLEQTHGARHPEVVSLKARLAESSDAVFEGTVLVLARTVTTTTTLRDVQIRSLAGRQFLAGTEVKSDYTKG